MGSRWRWYKVQVKVKIMLGDVEGKWQEGASKTHYRVALLLAVFVRVDNSTEWEAERREKREL